MKYLIFLSLLVACSGIKTEQNLKTDLQGDGLHVKKYVLDNGLRLIVHENSRLPIVSYYTLYNVGGRFETPGVTGATHFLEHLMFEGTSENPRGIFDRYIEESGGTTNAYTSLDRTVYYQNFPSTALKRVIELEADRMHGLYLTDDSFNKEKMAVFEERKMRYENSPEGKLFLNWRKAVYKGTPYESPVIGYLPDLKMMSKKDIMVFYKKYYAPNNAVLVIAGDVVAEKVYQDVKLYYGKLKSNPELVNQLVLLDRDDRFQIPSFKSLNIKLKSSNKTPILAFGWKGWPMGTRKALAADMVASIIGHQDSSYLNRKLVNTKYAMARNLSVYNETLKKAGSFLLQVDLLPKVSIYKFKKKIGKLLRPRFCDKEINIRNVQKAKNNYLIDFYRGLEKNSGRAHILGIYELMLGDYNIYQKEIDEYMSLDLKEVKSVCREIFSSKKISLSIWNKN